MAEFTSYRPGVYMGEPSSSTSAHRPLLEQDELAAGQGEGAMIKPVKETKGGASEFVKKLYRMLEDVTFIQIVCWGNTGDSFVVKDMNQFTRSILPLHFKHSNFASFVRQLNKYDFHKVKNPEEGGSPYGEHTWEFKHPNFRSDMKSSLEHIKRKAPAPRKGTPVPAAARGGRAAPSDSTPSPELLMLQNQVDTLSRSHKSMGDHMTALTQDYQTVVGELMNFQRNLVAQDQLMQNLIQYLVNLEADQKAATDSTTNHATNDPIVPFVPSSQAQKLITSYTEVARASYDQMADLSRRASLSGGAIAPIPPPPPGFGMLGSNGGGGGGRPAPRTSGSIGSDGTGGRDVKPNLDSRRPGSSNDGGARGSYDPRDGLSEQQHRQQQQQREYQIGQQQQHQMREMQEREYHAQQQSMAREHAQQQQQQHLQLQQHQQQHSPTDLPPPSGGCILPSSTSTPSPPATSSTPASRYPITRKPSYVPGWAIPPRVLLVEDDAVCRKLSSKFLQVFGCEIDVAVDGVSAVNKMNLEKYDLVLMDIVMPNLDGVSATSLIRQFDPMTPIISMTSNSGPNEIMTYFSHGMNDILPKPFTKEGLLGMLEKHLIHLKVMQQMAEIPRALGFTEGQIQDAVAVSTVGEEGNVINPFSAMGISDADYVEMLQGIALEKEGKRGLEVVQGNEREGKRARFQEVEEIVVGGSH